MKLCFTDELFARAAMFAVLLAFVPVADVEEIFYEIAHYIQTRFPKLTRRLTFVSHCGQRVEGSPSLHTDTLS